MKYLVIALTGRITQQMKEYEKAIVGAKLIEIVDLPPHNDMYQEGERQKDVYMNGY